MFPAKNYKAILGIVWAINIKPILEKIPLTKKCEIKCKNDSEVKNEYVEAWKTTYNHKIIIDRNYRQRKRLPCLNQPKKH